MTTWNPALMEVFLSEEEFSSQSINKEAVELLFGGRALGSLLAYQMIPERAPPLGKWNSLIFATGPLTGTGVPSSGRSVCIAKSPLTQSITCSSAGGRLGAWMRLQGVDFLRITGIAKQKSYLLLDSSGGLEFLPAGDLWGKDTLSCENHLRKKYGKDAAIAVIGPAGENSVAFASIVHDTQHVFARGGLGAIMGSKNLKALVIEKPDKENTIKIVDPEKFEEVNREFNKKLRKNPWSHILRESGTMGFGERFKENLVVPVRNFQKKAPEKIEKWFADTKDNEKRRKACWSCVVNCNRDWYLTNTSLGPNLEIFDPQEIRSAIEKCDHLGMDAVSAGGSLAAIAELREKRKIPSEENATWGEKSLYTYLDLISSREGIGDRLSGGSRSIVTQFNECSLTVKQMEIPPYDFRYAFGMGLSVSISTRGACQLRGGFSGAAELLGFPLPVKNTTFRGKPHLVRFAEDIGAITDSLILCYFLIFSFLEWNKLSHLFPTLGKRLFATISPRFAYSNFWFSLQIVLGLIESITGQRISRSDLFSIGSRTVLIERLFNARDGFQGPDDILPERFFEKDSSGAKIPREDYYKSLVKYRHLRGLSEEGERASWPTMDTLNKYGIKELVGL